MPLRILLCRAGISYMDDADAESLLENQVAERGGAWVGLSTWDRQGRQGLVWGLFSSENHSFDESSRSGTPTSPTEETLSWLRNLDREGVF